MADLSPVISAAAKGALSSGNTRSITAFNRARLSSDQPISENYVGGSTEISDLLLTDAPSATRCRHSHAA